MRFFSRYFTCCVVFFGIALLLGCNKKTQDSVSPSEVAGVYIRGKDGGLERLEVKRGGRYTQEIYKDNQLVIHSKGTWWPDGPYVIFNNFVPSKKTEGGEITFGSQKIPESKASWEVSEDGIPRIILDNESQNPDLPFFVFNKIKNL
jgi:hypothetical protein